MSNITLTFLTTGTVRIRPSMRSQPANSYTLIRRLRSLTDRNWTEPLPVGVFIIHHPDGPILFDTGQSPCCNNSGYFPRVAIFNSVLSEFTIQHEDGIVEQLAEEGIKPSDLQAIVLSHLHNDHAGGLEDLAKAAPEVPIYISKPHWKAFGEHPFFASIEGATPAHWPENFSPRIYDFHDRTVGTWKQSYPITADGKIVAVDTSGHVPGHVALIVYGSSDGKETTYLLPGDATYGLDLLDKEEPDGINDDPMRALESLKLMKEFATMEDVVVLPSHDVNTPRLLKDSVVYRP
ncbi:hypothetical protein ASPWEDRAFT_174106 [Aspergillus wentii DTO 134E9]|uniref:Metallo-beta-lactamase domain-containing protein n=1 Tax=Aspergillus wentii DTO 134E9 TaxID=1073089 RepID=A0A1L9RCL3_ASPWE|nr:uncharacterized protein ASPWEDRAFT_174106 [Aspergillus wentii DTO 134E9]KAI9924239.1 hypothetical protein MW887_007189 [Aspergillus wentii]OJJ32656.1 hypothetical protein ASPWEDRAFT_174106 [Aspergillus wentii DTO 134E9]